MVMAALRPSGWQWPEWGTPDEPERRERFGRIFGSGIWLAFLIAPVTQVLSSPATTLVKATVIVVATVYGLSYVAIVAVGVRFGHTGRALAIAWLWIFPIALAVLLGPSALTYATYSIATALVLLPRNVGAALGVATAVAQLVLTRIIDGHAAWGNSMTLVVLTGGMYAFGTLMRTIVELRRTQDKMAKLAVAEERSRLARDLHDVLGHSLTTITVKSGLARRLLETSTDHTRAIAEVRDVEELARQAMTEVRATVSGYRTASLPAELVGARAALTAAGIEADLPVAVDNVAAALQETFAYVLREGVTNVIRHSGASRCAVRLGADWLEVRDNGTASMASVARSRESGGGHGLSGLAERMGRCGGELDAGPVPGGGFRLRVTAPADKPSPADDPVRDGSVAARPSVGLA